MLLALGPPALVALAVGPLVDAPAVLLVLLVEALEEFAVCELVGAERVHQVVAELALVRPPVRPLLLAGPVYHVVRPVTSIH